MGAVEVLPLVLIPIPPAVLVARRRVETSMGLVVMVEQVGLLLTLMMVVTVLMGLRVAVAVGLETQPVAMGVMEIRITTLAVVVEAHRTCLIQ
jgi:hypothetical protein